RALTRFEELRMSATQAVVAANGGSLLTRIRRLVVARAESANRTSRGAARASGTPRGAAGAALLTVVAAIFFAPALPVFANHEDQKTPPPPPTASAPAPPEKPKASKSEVDVDADTDTDTDTDMDSEDKSDDQTPEPNPMPVIAPNI